MLSPGENARCDRLSAFLSCAVTSIRRAPIDAIQNGAKRDSFSRNYCGTAADFSRLWRGLEQTAFKCQSTSGRGTTSCVACEDDALRG